MQITVKLFASFRRDRFISEVRDYRTGTTVADILDELGIAVTEIGTIMCNNRHALPEQILVEGDRLAIFPLVGGG